MLGSLIFSYGFVNEERRVTEIKKNIYASECPGTFDITDG